ncbi:MAG: Zn-ribbon domain-containing OB-fold protein [Deltaproteobacteria bacterium]|nr:Zn-ribbon domain-containing OB-fold protein [Deltaproteobacteria bacterium]
MPKKELDERFKKFGTVSFISASKVNDFIDFLDKGKIMGTECRKCGEKFFPPRSDCCQCFSSDMEWFEVYGKGRLVTYSKLEYAPLGFEEDLPYCIALLDYGDYKVFGRVDNDLPEEEIRIGMEMQTEVNTLSNGQLNYVFIKG